MQNETANGGVSSPWCSTATAPISVKSVTTSPKYGLFRAEKNILNNKFKERCNQSHIKLIYSIQRWGNLWNRWALLIWHLGRKILILGSPLKIQGLGRKIGKILFFAVLTCLCCFQFWRPDIGFERVGQLKFLFGGN